jgi:hypothetical protein
MASNISIAHLHALPYVIQFSDTHPPALNAVVPDLKVFSVWDALVMNESGEQWTRVANGVVRLKDQKKKKKKKKEQCHSEDQGSACTQHMCGL